MGSRSPVRRGNFEREKGRPTVKYCREVCKKRLNRSRCRLGCGLRRAQENTIRWGPHWRNLANTIEPSLCGGDAAVCELTLTTKFVVRRSSAVGRWRAVGIRQLRRADEQSARCTSAQRQQSSRSDVDAQSRKERSVYGPRQDSSGGLTTWCRL